MLSLCRGAPKATSTQAADDVQTSVTVGTHGVVLPPDQFDIVPREKLFVSEPDPRMFGNGPNPPQGREEGWSNENWLKSRFHFSFAEYNNGPRNFGVLRVMNDDLVQPQRGFGMHPHRDMEIVTYVVDGMLTHKDSMGTEETIGRGSIQFMTAGTGIRHSEHNLQPNEPLRFVQMWITPRKRGLQPKYGSMVGDELAGEKRKDQWALVVSDIAGNTPAPVQINQDCNMFVTELSPDRAAPSIAVQEGRQVYMLCLEGTVYVGDRQELRRHDAAKVQGRLTLELLAGQEGAFVLLVEMSS